MCTNPLFARALNRRSGTPLARVAAQALPGLPVWAIDADGIIVRPGPRLVTGVEALAALLHPGAAAPALPGTIQRVA